MRTCVLSSFFATLTVCFAAQAGIRYKLHTTSGATTDHVLTGGAVDITNGGAVTNADEVHIYSNSATPLTESVAACTINGTTSSATLRILVGEVNATFPLSFLTSVTPDIVNFGGLSFAESGTRDKSRLVLSAVGDLTGPINVGQVFRIDVVGSITSGGDITFHAVDGLAGFRACEVVTCGGNMLGDVQQEDGLGTIGSLSAPSGAIGPAPGTTGPAIHAGRIVSARAREINAVITTDELNQLYATVGGVHGTVNAALLVDDNPGDGIAAVQTTGASTATLGFGTVSSLLDLRGNLDGNGAGIFVSGNLEADVLSTAFLKSIHVDGHVCSGCSEQPLTIRAADGMGEVVVSCQDCQTTPADSLFILDAPSVDSVHATRWIGSVFDSNNLFGSVSVHTIEVEGDWGATLYDKPTRLRDVELIKVSGWLVVGSTFALERLDPGAKIITQYISWPTATEPLQVEQIGGLQGQITTSYQFFDGFSIVVGPYADPLPSGSIALVAANGQGYDTLPNEIGGGAIGHAPFRVHTLQSNFLNDGPLDTNNLPTTPRVISSWNAVTPACTGVDPQHAFVEFYGPIALLAPNPNGLGPVSVQYKAWVDADHDNVPDPDPLWWEVSHRLEFTIDPAHPRVLRIKPKAGFTLFPGEYRVQTWTATGDQRVVCDPGVLLTAATVPVAPVDYTFFVYSDCNPMDCAADNLNDPYELGVCGTAVPNFLCDDIDFNGDGLFPDTADLDDFLTVLSGGACPTGTCNDLDFNNDTLFPDTRDYDALLSVFSGGWCLL